MSWILGLGCDRGTCGPPTGDYDQGPFTRGKMLHWGGACRLLNSSHDPAAYGGSNRNSVDWPCRQCVFRVCRPQLRVQGPRVMNSLNPNPVPLRGAPHDSSLAEAGGGHGCCGWRPPLRRCSMSGRQSGQYHFPRGRSSMPTQSKWNHSILQSGLSHATISPKETWLQ